MATEDLDPFGNYYFSLEIGGVELAHFLEFSGLKTSAEVFEIKEGGYNGATHKLPGRSTFGNLTLKYATSASTQLAEWRDRYILDQFETRETDSAAIIMRNNKGDEVRRYSFNALWPVSWEGPSLSSGGSALAVETLELAFDAMVPDEKRDIEPEPEPEPEKKEPQPLVTAPVPFHFDSDKMKPEGEKACEDVHKSIMAQDPPPENVWIDAHTCTMGDFGYNLGLSEKRAKATAAKMQQKAKDAGKNVTYHAMGFSYRYPATSNATKEGREANRRSEFFGESWQARGREVPPIEPKPKPG
jgi:phage tail-like protein